MLFFHRNKNHDHISPFVENAYTCSYYALFYKQNDIMHSYTLLSTVKFLHVKFFSLGIREQLHFSSLIDSKTVHFISIFKANEIVSHIQNVCCNFPWQVYITAVVLTCTFYFCRQVKLEESTVCNVCKTHFSLIK